MSDAQNLIRGRGLFCRSIMKSQMASPTYTPVFAALVAVVNTKFPEIGALLLHRLVLQARRARARQGCRPQLSNPNLWNAVSNHCLAQLCPFAAWSCRRAGRASGRAVNRKLECSAKSLLCTSVPLRRLRSCSCAGPCPRACGIFKQPMASLCACGRDLIVLSGTLWRPEKVGCAWRRGTAVTSF